MSTQAAGRRLCSCLRITSETVLTILHVTVLSFLTMEIDSVRKFCLSLPNVTERVQWENDLLFCIRGEDVCCCCRRALARCLPVVQVHSRRVRRIDGT